MRLQLSHIEKSFPNGGTDFQALKNINLKVNTSEFVCLVGPSGCGKSTLLSLMAGLEQPTSGNIKVKGKLGFMFQEPTLFPWLKVKDNIAFGLKINREDPRLIEKKVDYYLRMVRLRPFGEAYPHELSGGMKQRVALARILILEPEILLMDEPFSSLDAQTREILYQDLQRIWQITKKTIIFVTHNVREAVCLGSRVIVFTASPGRIKKEFEVNLKRPRNLGSLPLIRISNKINLELRKEIVDEN